MHIADGVIERPAVVVGTWILGGGGVLIASRWFSRGVHEDRAALVGVLGAFIFAAQMVNFPLLGLPVSAHLVGTGLLTLLLGPAAAIVVMAAVLLVQALLFQDGGVVAWGANALGLAVVGAVAAAGTIRAVPVRFRKHSLTAAAAGTAAVLGSTLTCGLILVLGTELDPTVVLVGMGGVQAIAAVAEGAITALAFSAVRATLGSDAPLWPSQGEFR